MTERRTIDSVRRETREIRTSMPESETAGRDAHLRRELAENACVVALSILLLLAASCALPGQRYAVAPAIGGSIRGADFAAVDAALRLDLMHRESPDLFDVQQTRLQSDGHFSFDAVALEVAGHEFSKYYRVFLHYRAGQEDRVIWRAEFSRNALSGQIELDCDLGRPPQHGQACWLKDASSHPWFISKGRETFSRLCARCHGDYTAGLDGIRARGEESALDLRLIAQRRNGRFDRSEIAEWIEGRSIPTEHGTRTMPIWGERLAADYGRYADADALVGATLDPVLAYLESLQE